jgi:hypothetical protein
MSYNYSRRDTLRGGKKKKDKKDKKKKALKNRRKPAYTVRQPAKKRFSLHSPRTFRNPLQGKQGKQGKPGKQGKRLMKRNPMTRRRKIAPSFHQESVSSSSSYSNIMGKEDFKRNIRGYKNMNGKEAGIEVDQDNNLIRVRRY